MKTFKQLLNESQREYHYRLKTVARLDDDQQDNVEQLLNRYGLISISPTQVGDGAEAKLDFADIDNAEITCMDFTIGVPMSAYILQQELRAVLNVPEKFVLVRSDNDPIEVEAERLSLLKTLDHNNKQQGLTDRGSLLSTDANYYDAEQPLATDVFGNTYNKRFLNLLAQVAANRKNMVFQTSSDLNDVAAIASTKREPSQPGEDFNAGFDAPSPVNKFEDLPEPTQAGMTNQTGSFDDDVKRYFRVNKDAKGSTVVTSIDSKPMRGKRK